MQTRPKDCVETLPPFWYQLFYRFLQIVAHGLFRIRIGGVENIPAGSYIVVANHLSWVDPFLMMLALPPRTRLYFIGAKQAVDCPWKAWLMRRFEILIPFERGAAWMGKTSLVRSFKVLDAGAILGIFPEGRVGFREGDLLPIQRGIGHVLLHSNHPILPIALSGTQELYFRKPITVTIGKPLQVNIAGLDRRAAIDLIVTQVQKNLRSIIPAYCPPTPRIKVMRFLTY